jgi:hypothetical protein
VTHVMLPSVGWAKSYLTHFQPSTMSFATLPLDLVDPIPQCLQEDEKTSRARSLVCHAWLHSARRNIFSRITLRFSVENSRRFLALLQESPAAASLIRRITWNIHGTVAGRVPNNSVLGDALLRSLALLSETQGVLHIVPINMQRDPEYILGLLEQVPQLYAYVNTVLWDCQTGSNDWQKGAAQCLALKLNRTRNLIIHQWIKHFRENPFVPTIPTDDLTNIFPTAHIKKLNLTNTFFRSNLHYLPFLCAFRSLEELICERSSLASRDPDGEAEYYHLSAPPLRWICFSHNSDVDDLIVKWLLAQSNPLQL